MRSRAALGAAAVAGLAAGAFFVGRGTESSQEVATRTVTVAAQKTGCHLRGALPDRRCTPGAADPRVTQSNIDDTICRRGYSKSVRPPVSVTRPLKRERIAAYGLPPDLRLYELDHLISLELGGAPADTANLWPEPFASDTGARTKDRLENRLHRLVCDHQISLRKAQRAIAVDWMKAYRRYLG